MESRLKTVKGTDENVPAATDPTRKDSGVRAVYLYSYRSKGYNLHRHFTGSKQGVTMSTQRQTFTNQESSRRRDRQPAKRHTSGRQDEVRVPEPLQEAIDIERGNLSKAESILGCLVIAMESASEGAGGPYYPDVAQIARELVRKSINGLDSLTLQQRLLRDKVEEAFFGLRSLHRYGVDYERLPNDVVRNWRAAAFGRRHKVRGLRLHRRCYVRGESVAQ